MLQKPEWMLKTKIELNWRSQDITENITNWTFCINVADYFLWLSVGEIFSSLAKQEGAQFLITVEEKMWKENWILDFFPTEAITDTLWNKYLPVFPFISLCLFSVRCYLRSKLTDSYVAPITPVSGCQLDESKARGSQNDNSAHPYPPLWG